jgi:hypothetical protein
MYLRVMRVFIQSSLIQWYPTALDRPTKSRRASQSSREDRATSTLLRLKAKAVPIHATKALGWRGGMAATHCRTRHLMAMSDQRHARPRFTPSERTHGTHCTGGWVGPSVGLDTGATGKNPFAATREQTSTARSSST